MTKLEQVYKKICGDEKIKNIIMSQVYEYHLRDDFYQEMILKILEFKNTDLLIEFYDKDILERFIVKLCRYSLLKTKIEDNGVRRGGGDFYIKYILDKKTNLDYVEVTDTIDLEKEYDVKVFNEKIDTIMKSIYSKDLDKHYHNLLFSLYRNGFSYSEISEQTGINYHSIRYSIQKTLGIIKKKMNRS
jgi:hypothetical protein